MKVLATLIIFFSLMISVTKAFTNTEDDANIYYNNGNVLLKSHQYQKAVDAYDMAIKYKPGFAEAYYEKGNALFSKGINMHKMLDYQDAIAAYNNAIKYKPNFAEAYYKKGEVLATFTRTRRTAIEPFEMAVKYKPNFAEAHLAKANVLYELRMYQEAINAYDMVIKYNATDKNLYLNKGTSSYEMGKYQEAINAYNIYIWSNPSSIKLAIAYNKKGKALAKLSRHAEAIQAFDKALKHKTDYPEATEQKNASLKFLEDLKS